MDNKAEQSNPSGQFGKVGRIFATAYPQSAKARKPDLVEVDSSGVIYPLTNEATTPK